MKEEDGSKRFFFKVKGSSDVTYIILPSSWRCSCPAWMQQTFIKSDAITCKHTLAVELCQALSKEGKSAHLKELYVSSETFNQMLIHMD